VPIIEFIKENWLYLAIVVGVIFVMTMIYVIYNLANKSHMKKYDAQHSDNSDSTQDVKTISLQDLIDQEIISSYESKNNKNAVDKTNTETVSKEKKPVPEKSVPLVENQILNKIFSPLSDDDTELERHTEVELVEEELPKKPEKEKTISVKETKTETKKVPVKSAAKPKDQKKELGRYHVLFRKEDRKWFVKREGSDKILRILETQREAIAFATIKAITQNTSFVIHKQDGKIRKQS